MPSDVFKRDAGRRPGAAGARGDAPCAGRGRARRSALWRRAGAARAAPAGNAGPARAVDGSLPRAPLPGTAPHLPAGGAPPPLQKQPAGRLGHRFGKGWWWHTRASLSLFSKALCWPKTPPVPGGLSQSLPYPQEARLVDLLSLGMNSPSLWQSTHCSVLQSGGAGCSQE